MAILSIRNITKTFGKNTALDEISFDMTRGEIVALLGPSGCGKSTLLSIIAGLEQPDSGEILWNGASIMRLPAHLRRFGLMFQDYALFPHKNVAANIAFGLKMAQWSGDKLDQRVQEMLTLAGLTDYAHRKVDSLSGGEQQRTALARSLAPNPQLLMLDEPLGSLDRSLRERLLGDLNDILRSMQLTTIVVTHDQEEAFSLADRVVVMNQGQLVQVGSPFEIYHNPRTSFVARFLGLANIFAATVKKQDLETPVGNFSIANLSHLFVSEATQITDLEILIRPDAVQLGDSGSHIIKGIVRKESFRGSLRRVDIAVQGGVLSFECPSTVKIPETGNPITVSINPEVAVQILR